MSPVFQYFGQWAVSCLALASNVQAFAVNMPREPSAAAKVPLRLMPLGASITMGYLSTDGNGYRKDLHDLLVQDGFSVDMVGSRHDGNMPNNEDEGWPGFRIEQVEAKAKLSVPHLQPNIFTINAGTNDCVQDFHISQAGNRMEDMIDYIWEASPGSTIILSTLIINLNSTIEARINQVNPQFRELAQRKASEGKRIVLALMHTDEGPQPGDMADETHPNDVGYDKMAKIWFSAIKEASAKGMIQAPQ